MTSDGSLESTAYHKVDVRLLPFLFLCYILAYLDRVNVGFAKLQMLKELSMSDAAFATGAGIFFIGYFFFEVPSNVLLKKFGARMWIARIMISWGVISACMIFVKGEWSFYAMRFLLGLAEAGFFPGVIFYLTLWYPSKLRASRTAWFVAAIAVSGVVGNRRFTFDIWGDAVNIASFMEARGVAGRINVSETVAGHVKALFELEPRGSIEAKHDRTHEMFFLNRLKPEFSRNPDGGLPNEDFAAEYNRLAGFRMARLPDYATASPEG